MLERLYEFAARGLVPSLARVLARFRANWEEQYDAERLRIVREEMTAGDYRQAGERCLENAYRRLYPFDDETARPRAGDRVPPRHRRPSTPSAA